MFHKTPANQRHSIKYQFYDENGNAEPVITICPGKDGVTEVDIRHFYSVEDSEVYHNIRSKSPASWMSASEKLELRNQKSAWAKSFVNSFIAEHGYEPTADDITAAVDEAFPKNWTGSIDAILSENDTSADKSALLMQAVPDDYLPTSVERLRELVDSFPERWQFIYQSVLLEGHSKVEVGDSLGISDVRVGQIIRQIQKRIAEDEVLKKCFSPSSK